MQPAFLLPAILVSFIVYRWFKRGTSQSLPLPPGPKGYPIIGNSLDAPLHEPWKTFRDWSKIYGDVIYMKIPKQEFVILGSAQAALDLLEKRSDVYSDRPYNVMNELMLTASWDFAFMRYSSQWRTHRREFHQFFHQHAVPNYRPIQLRECRAFLKRTLEDPTNLGDHIRLIYSAIILKVIYDMDVTNMKHGYIQLAETVVEGVSDAQLPGKFWVHFLPIFKYIPSWVPGAYFKKFVERHNPVVQKMLGQPFEAVKKDIAEGRAGNSVAAALIERLQVSGDSKEVQAEKEELARDITGLAYAAAADTTTIAAQSFFIAMSLHPEVQKKAQEELDRVVGPNRLPEFEDYENLVYIQAILLESMRWMPVTPIGVPHSSTRDDQYRGYHIPKGATILVNAWAILHDPEMYPDPARFNPDRYIKNGRLDPDILSPTNIAFGFGRRICPGRWLSSASLFMTVASVLHTLDIRPITGTGGKKFHPYDHEIEGIKLSINEVPCTVTPRSHAAETLIREWAIQDN